VRCNLSEAVRPQRCQGSPLARLQDGSASRAAWRAREYARRHALPEDLPVSWHLAEGLRLPAGLPELRAEIEAERQVLVVLDSLYTFLDPGTKLRDEEAAEVIARLKAEVVDATGCAVAVIDHSPWPSDSNRGHRRAFGSVFKAALARWTIHAERDGDEVTIEARGNDLDGYRERFVFDPDLLELVVDEGDDERDLAAEIERELAKVQCLPTSYVARAVKAEDAAVREALRADARFAKTPCLSEPRHGTRPTCWKLQDLPVPDDETNGDEWRGVQSPIYSSQPPHTPVGGVRLETGRGGHSSRRPDGFEAGLAETTVSPSSHLREQIRVDPGDVPRRLAELHEIAGRAPGGEAAVLAEVEELLTEGRQRVFKNLHDLPHHKHGARLRFLRAELDAHLEQHRERA
jgi:hypothetical protein